MILRRSRFIHQMPVGAGRFLIVHAISQTRLSVDRDINILLDYFAEPRKIPARKADPAAREATLGPRQQPQDGQCRHRLPGPGFPHHSQSFAGQYLKTHLIDRSEHTGI